MDTRIETMLSEFEGRAAPVYEDLLAGIIPEGQRKAWFAEFLGLMFTRTPTMRRMQAEAISRGLQTHQFAYASHDKAFASLIGRLEKEKGETIPAEVRAEVRRQMKDPTGSEYIVPQSRTLQSLGIADKLAPLFFEMSWTLLEPRHGFFITSDNPVVRNVNPSTIHPMFGDHGFVNKTAQVTFPLSPKLMLLMSWNDRVRERAVISREHVTMLNETRAIHSERCLYAHICHKEIQALAMKFKDQRPGTVTQGFGPQRFAPVSIERTSRTRIRPTPAGDAAPPPDLPPELPPDQLV